MPPIRDLLIIGAGGFLGANARYLLTIWSANYLKQWFGWTSLPYGTLFVNVTGSLLLAIFGVWLMQQTRVPDSMRLLIGTGFFGAYTTFSTYANESVALFETSGWLQAVSYIFLTNGLCLLGVICGIWIAQRWW